MKSSVALVVFIMNGCTPSQTPEKSATNGGATADDAAESTTGPSTSGGGDTASVVEVAVTGEPGSYSFAVTIASPDTGCEMYANWWDVVSVNGDLLYRRILGHSHVDEQPFTRSGGPVAIQAQDEVIVVAYMLPAGYGGAALQGSVNEGFHEGQLKSSFAESLAQADPQPDSCAF